jgi:uncharacterized protein (DUF952 family)
MNFIFHITSRDEWEAAQREGGYRPATFALDGFIHCSTEAQVVATADRIFRGRDDLVLLCIDPERVGHEVRYEDLEGSGRLYPHIYGVLELAAVAAVVEFPPGPDGTFTLPDLPGEGGE